jgi:hypothetical protein
MRFISVTLLDSEAALALLSPTAKEKMSGQRLPEVCVSMHRTGPDGRRDARRAVNAPNKMDY